MLENQLNKYSFLNSSQTMTLLVWVVVAAFAYGIAVGYSGKMLFNHPAAATSDTVHGRFGHVAKTL